jgi:hypothetical protein
MASNEHIRAIMALRLSQRQKHLLIGLLTFTRGEGGWRRAGITLLAEAAGQSPRTTAKARAELVAAGLLDYRRGSSRASLSTYRIRAPGVADHHAEAGSDVASIEGGSGVAKVPTGRSWQSPPAKLANGPRELGKGNAPASANASGGQVRRDVGVGTARPRRPLGADAARPGPGGAVVNSNLEGSPGAAPGPATGGRAPRPGQPGQDRGDTGHAECPECGSGVSVQRNGRLRQHGGRPGHFCPGSGAAIPADQVRQGPPPQGICAACAQAHKVRRGQIVGHGPRGGPMCPGSRKPPARLVTIPADRARAIADAFLDAHQDWGAANVGARYKLTDAIGRLLAEGFTEGRIGGGLAALHGADDGPAKLRSYAEALR